jgi:diguanylate cyclase (GGDEF)-like protein
LLTLNKLRLTSLADLTEKDLVIHYEAHLIWLTKLAQHIKTKDKNNFPELNEKMCKFGLWIDNAAKEIIHNDLTYTRIKDMHKNIHLCAKRIHNMIESDSYHALITYLEKTEFLSLSIGTELSLLDNIIINKKICKDPLTGALNRQALKNIFQNQYELALATNNPFVLAMCDLDLFKHVNDTYGHVAGDYALKLFVDIVKKNTRKADIVLRYGGEEFVIILPALSKDKALVVLEKIRTELEQAVLEFDKQQIKLTVSIGVTVIQPKDLYRKNFIDKYITIVDKKTLRSKREWKK